MQESILLCKNGFPVCRDQSPASELIPWDQEPVLGPEFLSRIRQDKSCKNEVKVFAAKLTAVKKQENLVRVVGFIDSRAGFTA